MTNENGHVPFEASDDDAAMMRRVQERGGVASYLKIGADLAGGNHTPQYDFDEACIVGAIELLVATILSAEHAVLRGR